ncbi:MAG: DUF393 domain-containing protein [Phycisphaerales bacterium]|nr:MAG: DUF393 domain-containing protein [Phycisphaerales bacterium]
MPFRLFFDGECPLCSREARFLKRLDWRRGRLEFVDITSEDFDATRYGRSKADFVAVIHGLPADGPMVTGMEVFRRAYAAVGLGWVLAPTAWPVLRTACDQAYSWFARNRLRLTRRGGRCAGHCAART